MAALPASAAQLLSDRRRAVLAVLAAVLGACQAPGPVFQAEERPDLRWPAPPADPRIRFAGIVASAGDLTPARGFGEGVGDVLFGKGAPERLHGPRSCVRTADLQRLWIADVGGRCVHVLDLEQRTHARLTMVGDSLLQSPVGVCLGPGESVFLCDSESAAIHRLAATDGTHLGRLVLPPELLRPAAIAWHAGRSELFVVDALAHDIKVLRQDGALVRVLGTRGTQPGTFNFPCAAALDGDRLWVADTGNCRVQAVTLDGEPVVVFGGAGDAPGDLAMPKGVAVDGDGHVYVVDARFENVQVFDREGRLLTVFGEEGTEPGEFWLPSGISIDPTGRIWVCDSYNHRIQVFDYLRSAADAEVVPKD